jgi:cell fate (sporulation/competence/biofilm development) regulator YlbF (YheA/YmcA/DUF963 family)
MESKELQLSENNAVNSIIEQKSKESNDVKTAIDLSATKAALEKQGTVDRLVDEKTKELTADAEAKKIAAETARIREEVAKVKQQGEKEIAELTASKNKIEQEIEELKKQTDKANAYFDANSEILRVVGIKKPLTLKAMQTWMIPASIIYALFQILLLPFTLLGFCIEAFIDIVGKITGKFNESGWKIALTIGSIIVIGTLLFGAYWLIVNVASKMI